MLSFPLDFVEGMPCQRHLFDIISLSSQWPLMEHFSPFCLFHSLLPSDTIISKIEDKGSDFVFCEKAWDKFGSNIHFLAYLFPSSEAVFPKMKNEELVKISEWMNECTFEFLCYFVCIYDDNMFLLCLINIIFK